jgi:hypothetical protein
MSLLDKASLIVTPNGFKASKLYSVVPSDGSGDLDVTRATTATRVNSLGLIESVANNVPRLDYTNGSCPSLLVEPQRTNNILYSEQFDNATWFSLNVTVTANNAISPDGTQNADKIDYTNNNNYLIGTASPNTQNTAYTISCYAKKGTTDIFVFREAFYFGSTAKFNLTNGTIVTDSTGTAKITSVGNGWYRCSITQAYTSGQTNMQWSYDSYFNTGNLYLWGAQIEAGAYTTSYIPTTTASVTRNADVISKTGITSLIGQTEGTIFVEEVYDASIANNGGLDDTLVSLTDGTSSNLISIFHYGLGIGNVLFFIRLSGATQVAISTSTPTSGTYKIALAYKNNDVVAYINGVQIGTDTSATIPATSAITLVDPITTNAATKTVKRKNVSVWKTRLTNAELATLTTL